MPLGIFHVAGIPTWMMDSVKSVVTTYVCMQLLCNYQLTSHVRMYGNQVFTSVGAEQAGYLSIS